MIELEKCCTCLPQESIARIRNPHAGAMSFKQRYSEFVFQCPHTATNCGLPDAQGFRGAPKAEILLNQECLCD